MRDMDKWKDRVEFALDNRQIFFLFFGLSVVGCFVFALGVLVGHRTADRANGDRVADNSASSLSLLEQDDALVAALATPRAGDEFVFQDGLSVPATEGLPETRDPEVPPRPEKIVKAEKKAGKLPGDRPKDKAKTESKAKSKTDDKKVAKKTPAKKPAPAAKKPAPAAKKKTDVKSLPAVIAKAAKDAAERASKPAAKPAPKAKQEPVMAAGNAAAAKPEKKPAPHKAGRKFTLQMKAFAKQADADKLAGTLRSNGHDVRVESADVRGRTWHRVRVGTFDSWDEALAAKATFEKREKVIAYVVRL